MKTDFSDAIHVLFVTGGVAFIVNYLFISRGYFVLPKREKERTLSPMLPIMAFALFLAAPLLLIPSLVTLYFFAAEGGPPPRLSPYAEGWLHLLSTAFTLLIFTLFTLFLGAQERQVLFGRGKRPFKSAAIGIASWAAAYPLMLFIGNLLSYLLNYFFGVELVDQVAVEKIKKAAEYPLQQKLISLSVIAVVPFLEELLFRGFLQGWLRQQMSRLSALLITSCLFALFHFSISQGASNLQILPTIFILSCYMGFLRERERSLVAPIALHSFFNATSILLLMLQELLMG